MKRKWWILVMVAVLLLVPAVFTGQEAVASDQPLGLASLSTGGLVRSVVFPAFSLASDPADTTLVRDFEGLRWKFVAGPAYLVMPRPSDWDGTSDIQIRMFFRPFTNTSGTVRFFVRPRVYNPGDTSLDATGVNSELVSVSNSNQFSQMTISIPATRFGVKSWWYLVFQRDQSSTPTYPDDVTILSVAIGYTALSPLSSTFLPVVSK